MPLHLVADEKHSWRLGERVFIPTTVGSGCFLGVDIVGSAETPDLVNGYGYFRDEAGLVSRLSARNGQYRWLGPHSIRLEKSFQGRDRLVFSA